MFLPKKNIHNIGLVYLDRINFKEINVLNLSYNNISDIIITKQIIEKHNPLNQ